MLLGFGLFFFFIYGKSLIFLSYLVASLQCYAEFCVQLASVLQINAFGSDTGISSVLLVLVYIASPGYLIIGTGITLYVS